MKTRTDRRKTFAVVSAGGYASRLGSVAPKSLIRIGNSTFLQILLVELKRCGVVDGIIYSNRPEYLSLIRQVCPRSFRVEQDADSNSTLDLIKLATTNARDRSILFCYGHAPRPASHIAALLNSPGSLIASVYPQTGRTRPCIAPGGGFFEPPYILEHELLHLARPTNWGDLFADQYKSCISVTTNAPNEFNSESDLKAYRAYTFSSFR